MTDRSKVTPNTFFNYRPFWFLAAAIVLVSFLLYWPNPQMGFVLDDHYVIAQNPVVKNPSLISKVFSSGLFDAAHRMPESKLNYYRPVLVGSFAFDYKLWGLNPFAERLVNIFLHILNSLFVFAFLYLLFRNFELAGLAAIFFCILPVHEWVVRYIVGRGDLLQTFFSLTSLVGLLLYWQEKRKAWLWLSLGLFVFALLSREAALLNVFYVFLVSYYISRRFKETARVSLMFLIVAIGYYLLRSQFLPISEDAHSLNTIAEGMILGVQYVLRFLMPWTMMAVFPHGVFIVVLWVLGLIGLLVTQLARSHDLQEDAPIVGFGVLWIAVGVSQFLIIQKVIGRLGPILSEHFLYFTSIGFVLLLAFAVERMRSKFFRKALFVGFIFYFLTLGMVNGHFWTSEETLLRRVSYLEGKDPTVAFEQVVMRFDNNEATVMRLINSARSPANQSIWYKRLGNIYRQGGEHSKAIAALGEAIRLNPSNMEALNELGVCLWETGRNEEGLAYLKRSLAVDPHQADAYRLLGVFFYRKGAFADAIPYLKAACANDPDQNEAALHLMMAYFFVNDQVAYLDAIDQTTQKFSNDRAVLKFAASELFVHGYFADTVKVLSRSRSLFAQDPPMLGLLEEARRRAAGLRK